MWKAPYRRHTDAKKSLSLFFFRITVTETLLIVYLSIWPLIFQYNSKNLSLLKSICRKCIFHKQSRGQNTPMVWAIFPHSLRNAVLKKRNMTMLWNYSKFCVFKMETQSLTNGVNFLLLFSVGSLKTGVIKNKAGCRLAVWSIFVVWSSKPNSCTMSLSRDQLNWELIWFNKTHRHD